MVVLTKKTFVALAEILAEAEVYSETELPASLIEAVVRFLKSTNPNFDRTRFVMYIREHIHKLSRPYYHTHLESIMERYSLVGEDIPAEVKLEGLKWGDGQ